MAVVNTQVWEALRDSADAFRQSPLIKDVTAQLPRNTARPTNGIPGLLQHIHAAGLHLQAMKLGSMVPYALSQPFFGERPGGLNDWLAKAWAAENAFRMQLAWIRAQLPGYPVLRVPDLVKGTLLTTVEYTDNWIWPQREYGLALQAGPPPVAKVLSPSATIIAAATASLGRALHSTNEWVKLGQLRQRLTTEDRVQLSSVNSALRDRLASDALDRFEPVRAHRRSLYRAQQLRVAHSELTGAAAEYSRAFTRVSDQLELTTDVWSELIGYGLPRDVGDITDLDLLADNMVSFRSPTTGVTIGQLVYVQDDIVAEAARVEKVAYAEDRGIFTLRIDARSLPGSGKAWKL